jgi:hypothetical protein
VNSQAEPLKVKHNFAINGSNAENKKVPILFASPEANRIWENLVTFSECNLALNSIIYVILGHQYRVLDINIYALLHFRHYL